jgi:CBS domain containing-hemolysin-like protein
MIEFILAIVCFMLALAGVVVRKSYYVVPLLELKRRAEKQSVTYPNAEILYRTVSYGANLRVLLWAFIGSTTALGVVLTSSLAPWWLSLPIVIIFLWISYSWLPASKVSSFGSRLGVWVAPSLQWILAKTFSLINRPAVKIEQRYTKPTHTGLYQRSDVLALITKQRTQPDNRISSEELEIIKRALTFDTRSVSEIMTARKQFKTVLANETIGPVIIDELHKTDQAFALVRDTPKGPVVATISVDHLGLQSSGLVRDHMDNVVYYLHEQDSLSEALHAIFVTNHPVFIVVNSHQEFVGIVSLNDVVRELLGHIPGDAFDQYADLATIAERHTHVEPDPENRL